MTSSWLRKTITSFIQHLYIIEKLFECGHFLQGRDNTSVMHEFFNRLPPGGFPHDAREKGLAHQGAFRAIIIIEIRFKETRT